MKTLDVSSAGPLYGFLSVWQWRLSPREGLRAESPPLRKRSSSVLSRGKFHHHHHDALIATCASSSGRLAVRGVAPSAHSASSPSRCLPPRRRSRRPPRGGRAVHRGCECFGATGSGSQWPVKLFSYTSQPAPRFAGSRHFFIAHLFALSSKRRFHEHTELPFTSLT